MLSCASTYSIVAWDPESGEAGAAVQSKFLSVGALVPWVKEGVGVIATQAKTNAVFIERAFALLQEKHSPEMVISKVLQEDSHPEVRQIGMVDSQGKSWGHTGKNCIPWAGHRAGVHYCCQGNVLLGKVVLDALGETFESASGDLAERLIRALQAAQDAGGERRGQESAALILKKSFPDMLGESGGYIDLRVDHSFWPLDDLEKLLQIHRVDYAPNHRDKFFPFKGETKQEILSLLLNLGYIRVLQNHENLEMILEHIAAEADIFPTFHGGDINGKLVHYLVNLWYQEEYHNLTQKKP